MIANTAKYKSVAERAPFMQGMNQQADRQIAELRDEREALLSKCRELLNVENDLAACRIERDTLLEALILLRDE